MTAITIPNGWAPRRYQMPAWKALESGIKRAVLVWHRRAGKDSMSLNWTAASCLDRIGTYWHMAPTQRQVRKIVWDGIDGKGRRAIDQAFPLAIRESTNDQEMKIRLVNGSVWQCVGSDNYDALVGSNPVGVVFSEWSLANPRAWDYVRPILAENGGWAMFIYTPRGRNHGASMLDIGKREDGWFAQTLTVEDTKAVPISVIEQEQRELTEQYGDDEAKQIIAQEWFCSFDAAIRGAYYSAMIQAAERAGRIGEVPHDPSLPVYTAWDLGIGDSTAIWFVQLSGRDVRVIDHIEESGVGLAWYVNQLCGERRYNDDGTEAEHPETIPEAAHRKAYAYAKPHYLPHDANVSELGTGRRRIDVLSSMGVQGWALPRTSVDDGIQAVRKLLPRCWFDAKRCKRGLEAIRTYHRDWDDKAQTFRQRPAHDWASHSADAFRYLATGLLEQQPVEERPAEPPKPFTDAWFAARDHADTTDAEKARYYR